MSRPCPTKATTRWRTAIHCRDGNSPRADPGCIAYALHNTPGKIRSAQTKNAPVYPHRGGGFVPGLCDASADVRHAYRAFFRDTGADESSTGSPTPLPEANLDACYWVFIHARALQYHYKWRGDARALRLASLIEQATAARSRLAASRGDATQESL